METKKRKSWFPVDQDHSRVTTVVPLFRQDDDRNLQVALQGDENQQPITVTVSDVLSLSTFSRRAVIDFGNISLTDRPITRYMLVENPHDDNQWVSIERNLPEQEFSMYWIGCEEGNAFGSSSQATCNIQKNIVEPMCIPASGGQCLLSITRNQAPQGTRLKQNHATIAGGGFHYVLHFRVNRAYLLHAAVIGRVLPHTQNRHQLSRPLPPICDTPNIPTWARTPFSELRACESSSYSFRPSARTVVTTNFRQSVRTMRNDKARPDFLPSDRPQWLSQPSCSPPQHRSVSQPPGSDIPLLRTLVVRSPSVGFSSQHSADHCHPPRPSLSPYLRTASQSKNSINGGSNPEKATPDSKLGLDFMNSTAIGFVSPKLIRSPALKGGPLSPNYNRTGPDMVGRFGNIFHPDFACALSEASEYGLTQWLNNVFAPCTAANSPSAPLGMLKGECLIENASYCTAVTQARELLRSSAITGPGQRLEREVDEGKITPVQDISFRVDKGAQRRLVDHLHVNYAPAWLHLALDALNADGDQLVKSGALHSAVESKGQRMVPLSKKLQTYMFTPAHCCIAQNRAKSFDRGKDSKSALVSKAVGREVPVNLGKNRDTLHNRYAIKRFLILVWLLDRLKLNRVLKFDPCLFRLKSNIKSTADSLLTFSRNFLTGENNLVRHLCTLGARVEVVQTALDEYQWEVTNLAVDLRDGVRLVKLAELLVPRLHHVRRMRRAQREQACPATLMSLVRFPAISRLQKIHNVDLALRTFDQCGNLSMADGTKIDPRDIVDGHREKSLTLLWCLLLRYQVAALVDIACLNEEIRRLRLRFADTREDSLFSNVPFEDEEEDAIHAKLLLWAASVVRLYDLKVENLDASFADGRAFCLIVHHYLPPVLPRGLIRQVSTSTVGVGLSVPPTSGAAQISWFNLDLFQRKLSALGDVPVLISIKPMIDQSRALRVLPPGIVLASLAYLASRFVQGPSGAKQLDTFVRNYAARIIQFNWRCYKQRMIAKKMRIIRPGRSVLGEALPTLELPENVIVRLQACCRGALARRAYRDLREENCRRVKAATTIQSVWRGYCVRKRLNLECEAACIIQNWWRGRLIRRDWLRKREVIVRLQACCRGALARRAYRDLREENCRRVKAATTIQSVWRGYCVRKRLNLECEAACIIQNWWRGRLIRRDWLRKREVIVRLQACCRGALARRAYRDLREENCRRVKAATTIQSVWRGYCVRKRLNLECEAACIIQNWWRGRLIRRDWLRKREVIVRLQACCRGALARRAYRDLREENCRRVKAATTIQSVWRGYCVRKRLNLECEAACIIQNWWRGRLIRRDWLRKREVIVRLQACCRGALARRAYRDLREENCRRVKAATTIQSVWRGYCVRKRLNLECEAACIIQNWWRGRLIRRDWLRKREVIVRLQACCRGALARRAYRDLREENCRRVKAATTIQSVWRGYCVRKRLNLECEAACIIQNWWRGRLIRRDWLRKREVIVRLQACCRGALARRAYRDLREENCRRVKAATTIQSVWRGYCVRKRLNLECEAACIIQNWWRGRLIRRDWLRKREVIVRLQACCRGALARRAYRDLREENCRRVKAATTIQSVWRGYCVRKRLNLECEAACIIQNWWRGRLIRRDWLRKREVIVRLQACCRGALARRAYRDLREENCRRVKAATTIQSVWRGYCVRKRLNLECEAACIIQNWWRGRLIRRDWLRKREVIVRLQACCRGALARRAYRDLREENCRRVKAATTIQSVWRGYCVRKRLNLECEAACIIQNWWRGRLIRRDWLRKREVIVRLQACCRGALARRAYRDLREENCRRVKAATTIQSVWRGYCVRKRLNLECEAACIIQNWWRGRLIRRDWLRKREVIVRLQACCRGALARRAYRDLREENCRRVKAATTIQSVWRGYCVRKRLNLECEAACIIQNWWRGRLIRRDWLRKREVIVRLQACCRGALARRAYRDLREENCRRVKAATTIQSVWRGYCVRKRLNLECEAACIIQNWWRGRLIRRDWLRKREAVAVIQSHWRRTLRRRRDAALRIQRCWRASHIVRHLRTRRLAAIRIQSVWRGYQARCQVSKTRALRTMSPGPDRCPLFFGSCQLIYSPKYTGIGFQRRLDEVAVYTRSAGVHDSQNLSSNPGRTLISQAEMAIDTLLRSKSITRVLDAVRVLESITHLSTEICYWAVGIEHPGEIRANYRPVRPESPRLHLVFLDLFLAANRSDPQEDILLSAVGVLLNVARHPHLAKQRQLWWRSPTEVDWNSPALVRAASHLKRPHSYSRCSTGSEQPCGTLAFPASSRRESSVGRDDRNHSTDFPSSVVEALVKILLRTLRARPGTVSLRLFTRTCCLLALICEATPADALPAQSILHVIRHLFSYLSRRPTNSLAEPSHESDPHNRPLVNDTNTTATSECIRPTVRDRALMSLRSKLSSELDWHPRPVKLRPDPLVAVEYLTLIVEGKRKQ